MSFKNKVRKLFAGALMIVCASTASNANEKNNWKLKSTQEVRNEKSVVEAMFPDNSNSSFWVSVRDDGSRRDGYADYLCLVLKDSGMPKGKFIVIKIWDAYSMAAGKFKEIGRSECKKD